MTKRSNLKAEELLRPLSAEELAKVPPLRAEDIDEALRKGREDREREEALQPTGKGCFR